MTLTERFDQALLFATNLHRRQVRKGSGVPYLSHLLGVSALVLEYGGDETQAIAALLHDAVEDQAESFGGVTALKRQIQRRFGRAVLDIVEACTDAESTPKPPWRARKERYLLHVHALSAEAALVSCCDKLHNTRTITADLAVHGEEVFKRFKGGREGTLWYYGELAEVFVQHHAGAAADALAEAVKQLRRAAGAEPEVDEGSGDATRLEVYVRPPFLPEDDYMEWALPPDSAGAEIKLFHNTSTDRYWLRYGLVGEDEEAQHACWCEIHENELPQLSSSRARRMLEGRVYFADRGGALEPRTGPIPEWPASS